MAKEITKFEALDGKLFDSLQEAEAHEKLEAEVDCLREFLHINTSMDYYDSGEAAKELIKHYHIVCKQ